RIWWLRRSKSAKAPRPADRETRCVPPCGRRTDAWRAPPRPRNSIPTACRAAKYREYRRARSALVDDMARIGRVRLCGIRIRGAPIGCVCVGRPRGIAVRGLVHRIDQLAEPDAVFDRSVEFETQRRRVTDHQGAG